MRGLSLRWPWGGRGDPRFGASRFGHSVTNFGESTFAEIAWQRSRVAARRWATWGAVVGALCALVIFAPASWLAGWVSSTTSDRLLLADARGTVWNGSAVAVLTAGADSRDATSLPGRLYWTLGWRGLGAELQLTQPCCLNTPLKIRITPGFGRFTAQLVPPEGITPGTPLGRWPAAWLAGLGTPWNTLQLAGELRLSSSDLGVEWVQGRLRVNGRADIDFVGASSRLSTLEPLGSYRFSLAGDPSSPGTSRLSLTTLDGALQLSGDGTLGPGGIRFRGEASATAANEPALNNLLNIIGRRNGVRSVISIG